MNKSPKIYTTAIERGIIGLCVVLIHTGIADEAVQMNPANKNLLFAGINKLLKMSQVTHKEIFDCGTLLLDDAEDLVPLDELNEEISEVLSYYGCL